MAITRIMPLHAGKAHIHNVRPNRAREKRYICREIRQPWELLYKVALFIISCSPHIKYRS